MAQDQAGHVGAVAWPWRASVAAGLRRASISGAIDSGRRHHRRRGGGRSGQNVALDRVAGAVLLAGKPGAIAAIEGEVAALLAGPGVGARRNAERESMFSVSALCLWFINPHLSIAAGAGGGTWDYLEETICRSLIALSIRSSCTSFTAIGKVGVIE
jgi:hypothetical protein